MPVSHYVAKCRIAGAESMDKRPLPMKWRKAVEALLSFPTVGEAATAAGVSRRTLARWLSCPGFLDAYRAGAKTVYGRCLATLSTGATEAAEALRACLLSPRPADRIAAARVLLEQTHKARELFDLDTRLAALEAALASKNGTGHAMPFGRGV
jgi:hypothetical protein